MRNFKIMSLLIIVIILVIVSINWFNRPILSEKGAELSQEVIKKDIAILTKDNLKIDKVEIFNNGANKKAIVEKNGKVDSHSQVIYIVATTKSSYPSGLEYREAVRVLKYLHQRKPPFPIAGVLTTFMQNPFFGFSHERIAFISNDQFLEQYNKYKDNYSDDELIDLISESLMKDQTTD
jgi:hypothetical protein